MIHLFLNLVLWSLLLTLILEYAVYAIAMRKHYAKLFLYVVLVNLVSWPIANLLNGFLNFYFIEFIVILIEIPLIKSLLETSWKKAIIISVIANIITAIFSFVFLI